MQTRSTAFPRTEPGALARGIPAELTVFVQKTYGLLSLSLILGAAACYAMMLLMPTVTVILRIGQEAGIPDFPRRGLWPLGGGTFVFPMVESAARHGPSQGVVSPHGLVGLLGLVVGSG